jgi:hypothetical protein
MRKPQKRLMVAVLSVVTSLIVLIGTPSPAPAFQGHGACASGCVWSCPSDPCSELPGCSGTANPVCPIGGTCLGPPYEPPYYWYCPEDV